MKITSTQSGFRSIAITFLCETQDDLDRLAGVLNHKRLIEFLGCSNPNPAAEAGGNIYPAYDMFVERLTK